MRDLERFPGVSDEELSIRGHGALVYPEDTHAAHVGIDHDLEYVGDHVIRRVRDDRGGFGVLALPEQEGWWITLSRIRQELADHVQECIDAGPGLGGDEAYRHQVPLPERFLEGVMQFPGR